MDNKRFRHITEARLARDADQQEHAQQYREQYATYAYRCKRASEDSVREGWHDFNEMVERGSSTLGRLMRQAAGMQDIESIIQQKVFIPQGDKLRAAVNSQNRLTITVNRAALAHQIKFSVLPLRQEIEQALGLKLSAIDFCVKPDLL